MNKNKSRSTAYHRSPLEIFLIVMVLCLFGAGVWLYTKNDTAQEALKSEEVIQLEGTADELDNLTEQEIKAEQSLEDDYEDSEQSTGSALEGAADGLGEVYDEASY